MANLERTAEKLFVLVNSNLKPEYDNECNMIMDVFLEEEFTMDELKRLLIYLLEKVKDERKAEVQKKIEWEVGLLEDAII
ncbi:MULTISPECIES: hypothetical protein [Bacillota]|jgi:hypothetical protein|uniref:Uncharacterized protein n=2 Tax=Amedibacillus TaxID=2749846 RepID=A0A7G9GKV6_9FIRM|nr:MULTISPECIES: hypothetical protein [Bacillota]QNM11438.1 hypothetical protein H9Q80_14450 [[Eubacterium] hominis]MCH4284547.1 hypothetical protein [Amedibacillus hominis]RGB54717.1 hypothetical protein DW271_10115 [Absiella sp. AM22-9]RGB60407.1 hypothetical protein DW120_09495 [Absiella sp. AM10-20]RGB65849.1 hypothetical protein DW113_11075 [Absiella sp. AM09-45]